MSERKAEQAAGSTFFKKAREKAKVISQSDEKLGNLVDATLGRLEHITSSSDAIDNFIQQIKSFVRLVWAYKDGRYRDIPAKKLMLIVAALLYFVMPIDLIPDFIPIAGLADDISIAIFVFRSVGEEIDRFRKWEAKHA